MVVQSQFIEMFGESFSSNETIHLSEMVQEDRPITYGVIKPGDFVEEGVVLVRVKDIVDGKILLTDLRRITSAVAQNYLRSTLSPGDILLSIRGTIGRTAIVTEELDGANITQDTARISLKEEYNNHFIKSVLDSPVIQDWIQLHVKGLAVKGINLEDVRRIPIPTVKNELQEIYITLYHQADKSKFNGLKSQFIEMFGRVSDKQPKYPIMKLSECCSYISDGSHFSPEGDSNGSYPMLSVKDMTETGFNYSDCKFIGEKDYNNLVQNGCKPLCGDVLVAKDGSYFKYAFALSDEKEQAILSSIAILRPIQVFISSRYLAYYMLTDAVIQLVEDNYLTGTAIKRVILKGFKEIPIIVPPLDSQNVFVRVLEQADKSKYLS